ncbi:MAG: hypothetical protein M1837_005124 [Sclerophora amabilis]|nr:MAG: hypothetical protein M1837_005124 [Sclerophora amabilis]
MSQCLAQVLRIPSAVLTTSSFIPQNLSSIEPGTTSDVPDQVFPEVGLSRVSDFDEPHHAHRDHDNIQESVVEKDPGFARFLQEVSSPTHNRVTAGGRIVPASMQPVRYNVSGPQRQASQQVSVHPPTTMLPPLPGIGAPCIYLPPDSFFFLNGQMYIRPECLNTTPGLGGRYAPVSDFQNASMMGPTNYPPVIPAGGSWPFPVTMTDIQPNFLNPWSMTMAQMPATAAPLGNMTNGSTITGGKIETPAVATWHSQSSPGAGGLYRDLTNLPASNHHRAENSDWAKSDGADVRSKNHGHRKIHLSPDARDFIPQTFDNTHISQSHVDVSVPKHVLTGRAKRSSGTETRAHGSLCNYGSISSTLGTRSVRSKAVSIESPQERRISAMDRFNPSTMIATLKKVDEMAPIEIDSSWKKQSNVGKAPPSELQMGSDAESAHAQTQTHMGSGEAESHDSERNISQRNFKVGGRYRNRKGKAKPTPVSISEGTSVQAASLAVPTRAKQHTDRKDKSRVVSLESRRNILGPCISKIINENSKRETQGERNGKGVNPLGEQAKSEQQVNWPKPHITNPSSNAEVHLRRIYEDNEAKIVAAAHCTPRKFRPGPMQMDGGSDEREEHEERVIKSLKDRKNQKAFLETLRKDPKYSSMVFPPEVFSDAVDREIPKHKFRSAAEARITAPSKWRPGDPPDRVITEASEESPPTGGGGRQGSRSGGEAVGRATREATTSKSTPAKAGRRADRDSFQDRLDEAARAKDQEAADRAEAFLGQLKREEDEMIERYQREHGA